MVNIDANSNINKSSIVLPNIILLFGMLYLCFVFTETNELVDSKIRRLIYYCLFLCDISALIYINLKAGSVSLLNKMWEFVKKKLSVFMKKKKESEDEIRVFVE